MSAQVFTLLFGLPFLWVFYQSRPGTSPAATAAAGLRPLLGLLAFGLLLRLPLLWDAGFHYDTGTYKAWALKLSDPAAPLRIYEAGYFADYPPLYMYILGALGWLAREFGLQGSSHFTALIKLPPLLADVAVTLLLHRSLRPGLGERIAVLGAGLYWLNPAIAFDSALWGQSDALLALFLLLAWSGWSRERLWLASLALGAAVAFKPQGLIFAFVYGLSLLASQPLAVTARQALIGFGSFALIVAPFAREQSLDWIFRLYFSTAETYDYLTVNAYNLWALFGLNWSRGEQSALGLDLQQWAMLLAAGALTAIALHTARGLRRAPEPAERAALLAWAFALAAMSFYMLAPRMHERYILSLLPLLLLLGAGDRLLRGLLLLWTAGALANLLFVYHHYVQLGEVAPADTPLIRLISAVNVLAMALTLIARFRPVWLRRLAAWAQAGFSRLPALEQPQPPRQAFARAHALSLLLLGGLALILGASALGSRNYPASGVELGNGEITLRFAEPVQPARLLVYLGTGQAQLRLQQRSGRDWLDLMPKAAIRDFYRLHELKLNPGEAGRVFRLQFSEAEGRLMINEIGLLDADGQALPAPQVHSARPGVAALVDEPATWLPTRGYQANTYFDEIYHARTAYEYLHRLPVYETTHPPLGKWLISHGISAFGMNPFGMRIAGVCASALIVVALAWGAWLLSGQLRAMWLTGGLALFEFSRYSIGRYSTIDAFLILFVLLCALCLWRSFCRERSGSPLQGWRLSPDLLLAGMFLGLAIATKWSALYFGFGIFLWFCWSLYRSRQVDQALPWYRLGSHAALAFGAIPLLIYYLSYIPFMRCLPEAPSLWSGAGLKAFWDSQTYMWGYHAHLKDSHAFASAFYTWPLLLKPLWLYLDNQQSSLRSSITLLGNPLIWWGGLLALLALAAGKLRWPRQDSLWLGACIACLYLPWASVSRVSFLYHYYPVIPFLLLLLGVSLARWPFGGPRLRHLPLAVVVLAGILFAWFYPAISGLAVPPAWSESLRWLPGWWML